MSILSNSFYYQPLKIDSVNTQVYGEYIAKEGDANGRGLLVTLTENGLLKDTTGITLNLKWAHSTVSGLQGLEPFEYIDLTKGLYKVKYPTNMLRKGKVDAFIQIVDSGSVIGSRNIKINVEATVGDDSAIESSNSFRALADALIKTNRVEGILNEAIANVTVDSEVITARNSTAKGKTFTVIDERIEEVERDIYFPAENILPNDDFANTSGWTTNGCTLAPYNNEGEMTITELGAHVGLYAIVPADAGNKYYISAEIFPKFSSYFRLGFDDDYDEITSGITAWQWTRKSVVKTRNTSSAVIFYHKTDDGNYTIGTKFNFRRMFVIDLTKVFGAGFEPSVDQMDSLMSQFEYKWFKGIGNLSQPALILAKQLSMDAQFTAAINGVTEGSETINARVGEDSTTHATLKARLDSEKSTIDQSLVTMEQQLEQAATKTELSAIATPKAVLLASQMLDVTKIYVYGGVEGGYTAGNWYYHNGTSWVTGGVYQATALADKSLPIQKLNFYKIGKNLFNKATATVGYYVNQTTGQLGANATYNASDFIEVLPNTQYTRTEDLRTAFYDANKTFISGYASAGSLTITTPANCYYVRVTTMLNSLDTFMLELGAVKTTYEAYKTVLKQEYLEDKTFNVATIPDGAITYVKNQALAIGKNLFDKTNVIADKLISTLNGTTLSDNAAYVTSYFLKVSALTTYAHAKKLKYVIYYDASQTFISGDSSADLTDAFTTPANCAYIRYSLLKTNMDTCMLELGSVPTIYEPYGYKFSREAKVLAPNVILNLPKKLYALVGQELNIYFDNIISGRDTDYTFNVVCTKGVQYKNFWRLTPTVAETLAITINAYKDFVLVATATANIVVTAATVGNGVTKNIIKIGDSTTDNGNGITKLNENFVADVMNINAIGTRGTAPNLHEGRSGWTSTLYTTVATSGGLANAFWNPNTSAFDFSYYISNNALSAPDVVFVNLGINDMFGHETDALTDTAITTAIAKYNEIIASIRLYSPTVKIALGLTIPPNYSQDAFGKAYASGQTRDRYKRNHDLWVKKLLETYDNRTGELIYVVPIYTNLDTRYNMGLEETQVNARNTATFSSPVSNGGVHPVESGYWQIADVEWYFLKSFEV